MAHLDDLIYCSSMREEHARCRKTFTREEMSLDALLNHLASRHQYTFNPGNAKKRGDKILNKRADMIDFARKYILDNEGSDNEQTDPYINEDNEYEGNFPISDICGDYTPWGPNDSRPDPDSNARWMVSPALVRRSIEKSSRAEELTYTEVFHPNPATLLYPAALIARYENLPDKRAASFNFYWKVMHTQRSGGGASISQLQKAIDLEYYMNVTKNGLPVNDIKSRRLRKVIADKLKIFGCQIAVHEKLKKNIWLPNVAQSLYNNARNSLLEVMGEYLNMYQTKIVLSRTRETNFYYVNPVPLAFLNLSGLEMRENMKKFKQLNNDSALYWNKAFSKRARCRLGTTAEEILKEHQRRVCDNPSIYADSSALLIRIFLDGAQVSQWQNASQTPILMTIGNLHPDLQVTDAAKILIGYYPDVVFDKGVSDEHQSIKRQQMWHCVMGEIIECFEQYHKIGGLKISYPRDYDDSEGYDNEMIERKVFPYILAVDVDGPERYKCAILHGKGCPRCEIVDRPAGFVVPRSTHTARGEVGVINMFKNNPRGMVKEMNLRPIRNSFWRRDCVPISVYELISTDILHEIIHGFATYVLDALSQAIKRASWNTTKVDAYNQQMGECVNFHAPRFIEQSKEQLQWVAVDEHNYIQVRKLEAAVVENNRMKLKKGTSIISWIYMSTIVMGYGETAGLSSVSNDLAHFRVTMNCIYLLLKKLETEELEVTEEWKKEVTDLSNALVLVLQDPHVRDAKEPTEKMHRLLHLVQNFEEHGCFKVSNLFHLEKCHAYFTKQVYDSVGKQSRGSDRTGPHLKMIFEVLMSMLMSTTNTEKREPVCKRNPDGFDDCLRAKDNEGGQKSQEGVDSQGVHDICLSSNDDGETQAQEEDAGDVIGDEEENDEGETQAQEEDAYDVAGDEQSPLQLFPSCYCMDRSSVLTMPVDEEDILSIRTKYRSAMVEWGNYIPEGNPNRITTPGSWNTCHFFNKLKKKFSLATVPQVPPIQCLKDGRQAMIYNSGDCIVLENLSDGLLFARIIAFVESDHNMSGELSYGCNKHFVLVQYLTLESSVCRYCLDSEQLSGPYEVSGCLEKDENGKQCPVCVSVTEKKTTKTVKTTMEATNNLLTKEQQESLVQEGAEEYLFTSTSTKEVIVQRKPDDHDEKMLLLLNQRPKLAKIIFAHYHLGSFDLQEVPNIVTKILMIKDVRCNVPAFFYIEDPLRNM